MSLALTPVTTFVLRTHQESLDSYIRHKGVPKVTVGLSKSQTMARYVEELVSVAPALQYVAIITADVMVEYWAIVSTPRGPVLQQMQTEHGAELVRRHGLEFRRRRAYPYDDRDCGDPMPSSSMDKNEALDVEMF